MASGSSSSRPIRPVSKPFAMPSDDVLCSYEDYGYPDGNNGNPPDPSIGANSTEEFHKSRMARSNVFPAVSFGPPEVSSFNQDLISTVENTVKKYTDNLMRFLEGISSRLSQLELYYYNLDKSIGEMHSELARDHREAELKLKSLEKHVKEVHRSVQILRHKQELAETQKELAKLQLVQKESSLATNSQQNEEGAPDAKKSDDSSDNQGQPLAVSLPRQVASQPLVPTRPVEHQQTIVAPPLSMPSQSMPQAQAYYLPPMTSSQFCQAQYLPTQSQIQDHSRVAAQLTQSQLNQPQQIQSLPPYQQWPPQHDQSPPPQLPPVPPQSISSSPAVYPSYLSSQPNPSPREMTAPNSIPMQVPFSGPSQPGSTGSEGIMPYGHGGAGRQIQPQPPTQHVKTAYSAQSGDVYVPSVTRPTPHMGNAYTMFDGEGRRTHDPLPQPLFQQNSYPPSSIPLQNPQHTANLMVRPPQFMRNRPYTELIEKLVGMGYRGDHVVCVIQPLEESGQPIEFNAVLDRLNGHSSGGSQRGWSG